MKRILILGVIMLSIITLGIKDSSAAGVVSYTTPQTGNPLVDGYINTAMPGYVADIDKFIKDNWNSQDKLAKGLGNANTYSSQAANLDGYQGYDLFAIMVGGGIGAQFPSAIPTNVIDLKGSMDETMKEIEKNGDVYAGVGVGAAANIGLHAKVIGLNNIYFNFKFGTFSYDTTIDDKELKASVKTVGFGVNYQWITHKNLIANIVKWRGISFGSGLLYNKNVVDLTVQGLKMNQPLTGGYQMVLDPNLKLGYDATTYMIPVDVNTSIRLLWVLNLNVGAGLDFIFGKTNINIDQASRISVLDPAGNNITTTPGSVKINASTKDVSPSNIRQRIQGGLGIGLGPIVVNGSVTWYLPDGLYAGLSAGIIW